MNENMKIVYYDEFCPKCKHEALAENEDPCHDCLNTPAVEYSHVPEYFEEK